MKSQKNINQSFEDHRLGRTASSVSENELIDVLLTGQVVTIPTETVEGYAVALSSEQGIKDLMKLKDRGFNSGKVFTLVPESKEAIEKYVLVPDRAKPFIDQYLPGELTIILPKNPAFHHFYYDHYNTIGIRIPDHPLFPKLLQENGALILTSANPRGGTPKSFTGHLPSTILDFTDPENPQIIRQGNLVINL